MIKFVTNQLAWINGAPVKIVRQVLFRRPAYRVRNLRKDTKGYVVDGCFLSDDETVRVDMFGRQVKTIYNKTE